MFLSKYTRAVAEATDLRILAVDGERAADGGIRHGGGGSKRVALFAAVRIARARLPDWAVRADGSPRPPGRDQRAGRT